MCKFFIFLLSLSFSMPLSAQTKALAFAGSARSESVNKKLIIEATQIARELGSDVVLIDLKEYPIPIYDGDFEAENGMPDNAKEIRKLMINSDLIIISSPEYNGSLSALLKNTIDWASRNEEKGYSREAFKGKTFVIMSASPSPHGGIKGLEHLRTIIKNIGGIVIPQSITVGNAYTAFDERGNLKDKKLHTELKCLIKNSIDTVQR